MLTHCILMLPSFLELWLEALCFCIVCLSLCACKCIEYYVCLRAHAQALTDWLPCHPLVPLQAANILHWQLQTCPYWTTLSMQSIRSIWAVVAEFYTVPSYHLTDFQFSQIVVTDFSYRLHLLTMHVACVTHDVIIVDKQMLSKEDGVLIKVLWVERGYGAKRTMNNDWLDWRIEQA